MTLLRIALAIFGSSMIWCAMWFSALSVTVAPRESKAGMLQYIVTPSPTYTPTPTATATPTPT